MASAQPSPPVVSDGGKKGGMAWRRAVENRFVWVASSPSPAEIYELERRFPEVVQVPVNALEEEAAGWGKLAVIARSLSRWVPPEAIIREFRREGISGEIEAVSLAHRHYFFRFADPLAKAQVLGKPWVSNGQIIAVSDWRPEFVPSDHSLLSALLWIRLPVLPIEFWTEAVVSSIVSVAGEFQFLDSSTKERQRGGYARACVKVDLSRPLRPGARIRGCGDVFWQQFVYEHLDGICGTCGSLHPAGVCVSASAGDSPPAVPVFGPWMAALRRRQAPLGPSAASGEVEQGGPGSSSASAGGWQTPRKVARRKPGRGSVAPVPAVFCSASRGSECPGAVAEPEGSECPGVASVSEKQRTVPQSGSSCGGQGSAAPLKDPVPGMGACRFVAGVPVEAVGPALPESSLNQLHLNIAPNPFALLGSDKWAGRPKVRSDAYPGPLKRARPVTTPVPRVVSRSSKGKGKSIASDLDRVHSMNVISTPVDVSMEQDSQSIEGAVFSCDKAVNVPVACSKVTQLAAEDRLDHDSAVTLLKKAILPEVTGELMDSIDQGSADLVMSGDRGGLPSK